MAGNSEDHFRNYLGAKLRLGTARSGYCKEEMGRALPLVARLSNLGLNMTNHLLQIMLILPTGLVSTASSLSLKVTSYQ